MVYQKQSKSPVRFGVDLPLSRGKSVISLDIQMIIVLFIILGIAVLLVSVGVAIGLGVSALLK